MYARCTRSGTLCSAVLPGLPLLVAALAIAPLPAPAQATPAVTLEAAHVPELPITPVMGANFSLNYAAQHNSSTGWSNVIVPTLSWRFTRHLFVSANVPWYATIKSYVATRSGGTTTYPLDSAHNLLGDTAIAGHFEAQHKALSYLLTTTVGFSTGNSRYGLSANTTTYNITNHFDYELGPFTPEVEFGEGNSSSLANEHVKKPYVAVGPLANFEVGTSIDLPWNLDLDLAAYESLPLGNQNVYGTITSKNKKGKTVTRQVLQGTGVAEDNGFTSDLDIPIGRHFTLSGEYDRSLIQSLDSVSVGLTWTLRSPKFPAVP